MNKNGMNQNRMNLNDWMMKFLGLDNPIAEAIGQLLAAVIRKDDASIKRLYEKLGGDAKMDA